MKRGTPGSFQVVGVGPGDPELITLKGVKAIEAADVIVAPRGKAKGSSAALDIVMGAVSLHGKEVLSMHFPMVKVDLDGDNGSVKDRWADVARIIVDRMMEGKQVVFPTLGDPAFYSTGFYVAAAVSVFENLGERVSFIPGVNAVGACSATVGMPAVLAGEMLAVVPAVFGDDRLEKTLENFDAIALMKVNRSMDRICRLLERLSLLDCAVLVEKTTMTEERVWRDLRNAPREGLHYFSTIIVRKRGTGDLWC